MKHLDTLLDELQEPIAQLMDWCKEDQDRAIVACIKDLYKDNKWALFHAHCEAYPNADYEVITNIISERIDCIEYDESIGEKPDIDYEALYLPLEHIINDRIDLYNRS